MTKYSNRSHIPQCSGPFNVRPLIPKCFVIQTEVTVLLEYFVYSVYTVCSIRVFEWNSVYKSIGLNFPLFNEFK